MNIAERHEGYLDIQKRYVLIREQLMLLKSIAVLSTSSELKEAEISLVWILSTIISIDSELEDIAESLLEFHFG